jgi:hypothetical protein
LSTTAQPSSIAAVGAEHQAVARLPRRRVGDVGHDHVGAIADRAAEVELHVDHRRVVGLAPRERHRQRPLGAGVDHGQRLQEVVDPLARHPHGQLAAGHLGPALVERDAVAVHDDLAEGHLVDGDVAQAVGRAAGQGRDDQG